jgi:hypothetical protein
MSVSQSQIRPNAPKSQPCSRLCPCFSVCHSRSGICFRPSAKARSIPDCPDPAWRLYRPLWAACDCNHAWSLICYRIGAACLMVAVNAETLTTRAAIFSERLGRAGQSIRLFDVQIAHFSHLRSSRCELFCSFSGDNRAVTLHIAPWHHGRWRICHFLLVTSSFWHPYRPLNHSGQVTHPNPATESSSRRIFRPTGQIHRRWPG